MEETDIDDLPLGHAFDQNMHVRELILFLTSYVWMCILLRSIICDNAQI
jgi:hypothetical protein